MRQNTTNLEKKGTMSDVSEPTPTLEQQIAIGEEHSRAGQHAAAIDHLRALLEQAPQAARLWFAYASALDRAGREEEAVPAYERALQLGLDATDLPRALLQLGSTLRNLGKHAQAVALLDEACRRFPEHAPLRIFLALARWSAGQPRAALIVLLELARQAIDTPEMRAYARAIDSYLDELRAADSP